MTQRTSLAQLSARGLTCFVPKAKGETRQLFVPIDLQLFASELVLLTGASGVGKSSLLQALVGLGPRCSGEINFGPERLNDRNAARHRRSAVYVAQNPANDADNVATYLRRPQSFAVRSAESWEPALQEQLLTALTLQDIKLDQRQSQLSGGEKKRLAIVRALLTRPKVLLLDEPSAGLDPERVNDLLGVLHRFVDAGGAILLVSHELDAKALGAARHLHLDSQGLQQLDWPEAIVAKKIAGPHAD